MTLNRQLSTGAGSFYSAQYSRFGSRLAAEVRFEAYGEDLGQQGWRSLGEQGEIIGLVQESPQGKLLDVACGSGGPSIAIAAATGCRLTGVDIEEAAIGRARALAAAVHLPHGATFVVADCSQHLPFDEGEFHLLH